jgi:A/G-specific adenine glycosylase
VDEFKHLIEEQGRTLYRDMPWRTDTRPYYVLVSELMLQQTQVARVISKFNDFIERFPNEASLASADLSDVLKMWQGLGYNRRAKFLHDAAKLITLNHGGTFPTVRGDLLCLPGVGKNTCGAIEAYAFNRPALFIETNVRTVYIHHFFSDVSDVHDRSIMEKLAATIDHNHPRQFYWALMDYGTFLKASGVRNVANSKHYKKQSKLEGSLRQMRGSIIRILTTGPLTEAKLRSAVKADERFEPALQSLLRDGLVSKSASGIHLTK